MEVLEMKVRFNFNLEAWIDGVEIEANSEEEAREKLYQMTFRELVEEGYDRNFTTSEVEGEIIEKTLKVRAFNIEYDIEEDDYEDKEEYIQIINSLPTELEVEITVDEDLSKYHLDEDDLIADEITMKTDWLVKNFNYTVLEEK